MIRTLSTLALSIGSLAALPALAMEVFYWPNPTFLKVPQPQPNITTYTKTQSVWKCIGCLLMIFSSIAENLFRNCFPLQV